MGWGLRIKKFNIMRVHWKSSFYLGGGREFTQKKYRGNSLKKGDT